MNINTQNYESYFLLYVDNELSANEKLAVEEFIKDHPTYAHELNILLQTVLPNEYIEFEEKAMLYRHAELEAGLPSSFKQSLYREEAKVITGFFSKTRMISMASVAALFLCIIGYQFYFNTTIKTKQDISKNSLQLNNINNAVATQINAPILKENNLTLTSKSVALVKSDGKLFADINEPTPYEPSIIKEEAINSNTENSGPVSINSVAAETSTLAINENNNNSITAIEPTTLNNTSISETENYNNVDVNEHDRSIFIANFEIDGEKLRGVGRRINAIFKRNKNEKQK
ncbi:MAG: hypothetical protein RLZ95_134 [Bacteroidota bacterium]